MVLKIIAYALTDLVFIGLLLCLFGVVNLLFRKPFLDQWTRSVLLVGSMLLGSNLFDFMPVGWHLPVAVGSGLFVLALMLWIMRRPRACRKPTDTGAGQGAA